MHQEGTPDYKTLYLGHIIRKKYEGHFKLIHEKRTKYVSYISTVYTHT